MSANRHWASLIQAAEYLGVTDRTVRTMIADGRITGYRNGTRLIRVDLNEIDNAMEPFGGSANSSTTTIRKPSTARLSTTDQRAAEGHRSHSNR